MAPLLPGDFVAFAVLGWFTPFEEKDEEGITVFANCADALAPLIHRFFYTLDGPPNRFGFEYRIHSFLECGLPRRRKRNITMPVAIQGLLGGTCLFGCLHDFPVSRKASRKCAHFLHHTLYRCSRHVSTYTFHGKQRTHCADGGAGARGNSSTCRGHPEAQRQRSVRG